MQRSAGGSSYSNKAASLSSRKRVVPSNLTKDFKETFARRELTQATHQSYDQRSKSGSGRKVSVSKASHSSKSRTTTAGASKIGGGTSQSNQLREAKKKIDSRRTSNSAMEVRKSMHSRASDKSRVSRSNSKSTKSVTQGPKTLKDSGPLSRVLGQARHSCQQQH